MNHIDLNGITMQKMLIFTNAAKYKSFSAAAAALYVTQPLVSRTIRELEDLLGFPLFIRDRHAVRLTAAGETLYRYWTQILSLTSKSIELASSNSSEQAPRISIADDMNFNKSKYLSPITESFMKKYPRVQFDIALMQGKDAMSGLTDGTFDVIFTVLEEVKHAQNPDIFMKMLHSYKLCADLSVDSPLCGKEIVTIEDIIDLPVVLWDSSNRSYTEHILSVYRSLGYEPLIHSYVSNEATFQFLRGMPGLVTITNELYLKSSFRDVVSIPIADTKQDLVLLWNIGNTNPLIKDFILETTEFFEKN